MKLRKTEKTNKCTHKRWGHLKKIKQVKTVSTGKY